MPSNYCIALEDNMTSEGQYSQEKLYGGGTSSKTWTGWGSNKAIPEKRNYLSKNSDKVEPITNHGPPASTAKKW